MISFLKKLLFCVGFLVLFSEGVFVVTAQNNPSEDIPCSGPNSGSCSIGGKQGVCRDFACDVSGETQSGMTYGVAAQLASDVFDPMLSGFALFKTEYETNAKSSDQAIAKANQSELEKFAPKYDKLMSLLTSLRTAYDSELAAQKQRGADAKDGHAAAAGAANKRWVDIKSSQIMPLINNSPQLSAVIREYFDKNVQKSLADFANSAGKIKAGASPYDEEVKILTDPSTKIAANAERAKTAGKNATDSASTECKFPVGFDLGNCLSAAFGWISFNIFITVPIFIFWLCSIFLDFSISFGLETMKTLVNEDIYSLWLFTRNLVLAAALFSFLYFVGMVIVGLGNSIKRAAVSVILFALFSGFSFSVSTYLIDASNLVTVSLYNSVDPNWSNHDISNPVIGSKFMGYLGYRGLANTVTGPEQASILGSIATTNILQKVGLNLIIGLTLIYNAYVILMMSLLFVVRDLGLIVGVVFSPLLLVDQAVPKLSDLAKKFRAFFTGQLLIGPVFMFLMYIGLKICDIAVKGINTKLPGQVGVPVGSPGVILFQVLMITGVFWYTYKTCKSLSGVLGEATLGAIGGLAQKAMIATPLGLTGQAASFVGKNTIGRAARYASREGGLLHKNQETFGLKGAYNAMSYAGNKATYDFNNSKFFAGAAQKAGMSSSIGGGFAGKTVSYADARQAAIAQAEKYAKDTKDPEVREKLINDSLDKFKRGNAFGAGRAVIGSKTDVDDYEKMHAQARKTSTAGQKTSLTDQVNDINFEDLQSQDQKKKDAALERLKELHAKAEKGGKDIKVWFDKYLQNKVLSEVVSSIKDDKTLDPLASDFEQKANQKLRETLLTIDAKLELKDGESLAKNKTIINNFSTQITQHSEQMKKEDDAYKRVEEKRIAGLKVYSQDAETLEPVTTSVGNGVPDEVIEAYLNNNNILDISEEDLRRSQTKKESELSLVPKEGDDSSSTPTTSTPNKPAPRPQNGGAAQEREINLELV